MTYHRKSSSRGLAGALLALSTLGACGGSTTGSAGAGGGVPQSAVCASYIACLSHSDPEALAVALPTYGPTGTCWDSPSTASTCDSACQTGLTQASCPSASVTGGGASAGASGTSTAASGSTGSGDWDGGPGTCATPAPCTAMEAPNCDVATHACVCSTVENVGAEIPEMRVAEAMPMATGGTLRPGRYVMTQFLIYTGVGGSTGPTGTTHHETKSLAVTSPSTMVFQTILKASNVAVETHAGAEILFSSPTTLRVTTLCRSPAATVGTFVDEGYDATETGYRIYFDSGTEQSAQIYTLM